MNRNELTELLLGREVSIRFVSIADAIAMHDGSIEKAGGTPGVRDIDLLESALHRPMQKCIYEDDTDLFSLAAALADGVSQNHAFLDGNKRTAFLCCERFLARNGLTFTPDVAEAVDMFRQLAAHEVGADDLAAWIKGVVEGGQPIRERFV